MRRKKLLWMVPLGILAMSLFVFIGGEVVMHLWNWLLPPLFGWKELTVWESLGMLVLCRILFGGFGCHSGGSKFRRRMEDRCADMTPEERERFRQGIRSRMGCEPPSGEKQGQ